ncbi:unnamed protein product [Cunninghamella blakesleeana]
MEAIDDYANEHLARSVAYTVLELRQQHHFTTLIPMVSKALKQRIKYLEPKTETNAEEWNTIIQWQHDKCPEKIEHLWQNQQSREDIYQNPVYYKRFDTETLHVVVPFTQDLNFMYIVILVLEQEEVTNNDADMDQQQQLLNAEEEEPELKYQNTKQISLEEWKEIQSNWSDSLEEAERLFLVKVTENAKHHKEELSSNNKDAPDDYWGDWSSDEEELKKSDGNVSKQNQQKDDDEDEEDDSEDDYYARWSENPGTLTPGLNETKRIEQEELQEEYDQSFNPLYTVPSVPNLVDTHASALQELTEILQTSLPNSTKRPTSTFRSFQPINPLPKAMQHQVEFDDDDEEDDQGINIKYKVPGAYPESRDTMPTPPIPPQEQEKEMVSMIENQHHHTTWDEQKRHAGKLLIQKSMRALIGAAKLLGLKNNDIVDMFKEIVDENDPTLNNKKQ